MESDLYIFTKEISEKPNEYIPFSNRSGGPESMNWRENMNQPQPPIPTQVTAGNASDPRSTMNLNQPQGNFQPGGRGRGRGNNRGASRGQRGGRGGRGGLSRDNMSPSFQSK